MQFWQYCGTLKKILFSKSEKSDNSMRHLETRNPGHYFTERFLLPDKMNPR